MSIIELPYGAVLLKNFINSDQQFEFVNDLLHLHKLSGNRVGDNNNRPNPLFTYNAGNRMNYYCKNVDSKIKSDLDKKSINNILKLGEMASEILNDVKKNDKYKSNVYKFKITKDDDDDIENVIMKSDSMYCVSYNKGNTCYRHIDGWYSWVVGVSFGLSSDFRYGFRKDITEEHIEATESNAHTLKKAYKKKDIIVKIDSGDILLFNGNLLHHSVTKIYDNLPPFWQRLDNYDERIKRICLQFRDSRTIDSDLLVP